MRKLLTALLASLLSTIAMAAVDVNTATATDLDTVKGIGPKMAATILDERKKNGPFKDWADFAARVKGVGEKNSVKFSEAGLTVDGKAYPRSKAKAKAAKASGAAAPANAATKAGGTK